MKSYKLLKSDCEKAWLFDCSVDSFFLAAGMACFLQQCDAEIAVTLGEQKIKLAVPSKAINNVMPTRIINARLTLLLLTDNEQIF